MQKREITYEYIRGLVDGEGCFTFCRGYGGGKLPTFAIQMHERDRELIMAVRDKLGLENKIYALKPYLGDGFKRGGGARLMGRDLWSLKNVIIPLFRNKLVGYKRLQFENWMEKIGNDPEVPGSYKLLYRLHKKDGFYDKNPNKFDI